jgi:hypothetical protein
MSAQKKCGLTIHNKEKYITANNIRKWCDEENERKYISVFTTNASARAEQCNAQGMKVIIL